MAGEPQLLLAAASDGQFRKAFFTHSDAPLVVYAEGTDPEFANVFRVDFPDANPAEPVQLNAEPDFVNTKVALVSNDATKIFFASNREHPTRESLYWIDLGAPAPSMAGQLLAGADDRLVEFARTFPGDDRLFLSAAIEDATLSLYALDLDGDEPGPAVRLGDPANPDHFRGFMELAPDGSGLVYLTTKPTNQGELWYVDLSGPDLAPPVRVHPEPGPEHIGASHGFRFTPDADGIVFTIGVPETTASVLHLAPLGATGPESPIRISQPENLSRIQTDPGAQSL